MKLVEATLLDHGGFSSISQDHARLSRSLTRHVSIDQISLHIVRERLAVKVEGRQMTTYRVSKPLCIGCMLLGALEPVWHNTLLLNTES